MNLKQQFETDEKVEVEGAWVPLDKTSRLKVARFQNPKHKACLKRLLAPLMTAGVQVADIPDEVYAEISLEAMAETILVGWEGIVNDNGEAVTYTKAEGMAALKMKDFMRLVAAAADGMENFRVARQKALEKNS